jgi:hypothetical protein
VVDNMVSMCVVACGMMYDGTIHTTYYLTCTYTGRNIGGLKSDRRAGWR